MPDRHGSAWLRRCVPALAMCVAVAANAGEGCAELQFRIVEGNTTNAFCREGPSAAHLLLNAGAQPRVLVAFPAGNSGTGLWFERGPVPVHWELRTLGATHAADASGRPLHGIVAEASASASRLVVRDAVLGSVRVLRDFQLGVAYPPSVATRAQVGARRVSWSRPRLDGAPGYEIAVELLNGHASAGAGTAVALAADRDGEPLRLRITALTGERPLTPLPAAALFGEAAGRDPRSREALEFLSYREKFLAGSWRFDTYFGRDTLMSLRLLMPALRAEPIEDGLASVLERLDAQGEVAHEEDIGEFAVLRRRKGDVPAAQAEDAPIYDYKMVDDDLMLAPVAAAWLLDRPEGRERAATFLARKTTTGETLGAALARNFGFVLRSAQAFAREPVARNLVSLKPGFSVGQWRDSERGLAGGRYAYDVNAVLMPAALEAIARFEQAGLLQQHATAAQRRFLSSAGAVGAIWSQRAPLLFRVELPAATARANIQRYATSLGVDPAAALASLPKEALRFDALSLDKAGKPIPVLHSDGGFALLFRDPESKALQGMVEATLRPFPAGLMTDAGMLVANPAFADAGVVADFGRNAYHGAVVWSWQQALMAAGLARQLQRRDLPDEVRGELQDAQKRLWKAIEATDAMRTSELWSWTYLDGRYRPVPFGQGQGDADESNAAQLWSTVYLAIPDPYRARR